MKNLSRCYESFSITELEHDYWINSGHHRHHYENMVNTIIALLVITTGTITKYSEHYYRFISGHHRHHYEI